MSATDYLVKAVEYDLNGRKLESLKLYQAGIAALLQICKGNRTTKWIRRIDDTKFHGIFLFAINVWRRRNEYREEITFPKENQ